MTIQDPKAPAPLKDPRAPWGKPPLDPSVEAPLPVDVRSTSELLALTHIFVVEIASARKEAWARQADGLEHRKVEMTAKLVEVEKGSLRQAQGATFEVEIDQKQMGDGMVMSYLGLWSHVVPEPNTGVGYLVMANGAPDADAAELMREGPLQRLFSPEVAIDVHLAKEAEKIHEERLHASSANDAELDSARALLAFTDAHRATARASSAATCGRAFSGPSSAPLGARSPRHSA